MKVSYTWLKDYIAKMPSPKKLADMLTMHSFEVSAVEKVGSDSVFKLEILPNRASDAMSHIGIAREIAANLKSHIKLPAFSLPDASHVPHRQLHLKISSPRLVPRYTAFLIEGVSVLPSPEWMQERLNIVGVRPINNIIDITNYIMLDLGQPLHAFDYHKIQGACLNIREARKGEKVITLDDVKRDLCKGALIIEDKNRIIDLAGIMGGAFSKVDDKTSSIILQGAAFDAARIRETERAMNHRTEASLRYGYGIDPNGTLDAVVKAAELVQKYGGKQTRITGIIDVYPKPRKPTAIRLSLAYASRLLGVQVAENIAEEILTRIGCSVASKGSDVLNVLTPTYRYDLNIPEDLIEEIGRIYGNDRIPPVFPVAALIPPEKNERFLWEEKCKDIMIGNGFIESHQYSFSSKSETENYYPLPFLVPLKNPASEEKQYLRPNLIFGILDVISRNMQTMKNIFVFEIGNIFQKRLGVKPPANIEEKARFVFAIAHKDAKNDTQAFYEAKGVLENTFSQLGIADYILKERQATSEDTPNALWNASRSAEIRIRDTEIGFVGEIDSALCRQRRIPFRVALCDIDFNELMRFCVEDFQYKVYAKYPSAVRDIALLVDQRTRVEDALNIIETAGGELVQDVDLFDLYAGPELPEGRKNFAFHIIFQSDTHTLADTEISERLGRIIKALEKEGWEVRKSS